MYICLHCTPIKIFRCQARETNSNSQERHLPDGCGVTQRIRMDVEELGGAGIVEREGVGAEDVF